MTVPHRVVSYELKICEKHSKNNTHIECLGIHSLTHSFIFSKYLWNVYSVPHTILRIGDAMVRGNLCFKKLSSLVGESGN